MASGATIGKILLPVVLTALVVLVGFSVLRTSAPSTPAANPGATLGAPATGPGSTLGTPAIPAIAAPANPAPAAASDQPAVAPAPTPAASPAPAPALSTPAALPALTARTFPAYTPSILGNLAPASSAAKGGSAKVATEPVFELQLQPTVIGAGISTLTLARHFDSISAARTHEVLQQAFERNVAFDDGITRPFVLIPMAVLGVTVDGTYVSLSGTAEAPVWRETAPGTFEAIIASDDRDVLRLIRRYELAKATYAVRIIQTAENLTSQPLTLAWRQTGTLDLPNSRPGYGGDVRRLRMGIIPGPASNPDGQYVSGVDFTPHATAVGDALDGVGLEFSETVAFPTAKNIENAQKLAWVGNTNRFFGVVAFSLVDRNPRRTDGLLSKALPLAAAVEKVAISREFDFSGNLTTGNSNALATNAVLATVLQSVAYTLPAASTASPAGPVLADFSLGLYAGPVSEVAINADAGARAAGVDGLVLYSFGGPCVICTFQSLTLTLRWYLGILHDFVLFDWALAVIVLVLTVRAILHPITRWSQINLQRFGKQMQKLAPKQAALKEKFGDDPKRLREEVARMMQEEKINYLSALGCLPMFLQMPVWIALYAMIFFTFELRHEPAFFGIIQTLSGGKWGFLGDLAEPDRLIPLGFSFGIPLLESLMGRIDAFNIIPLLLGVVFYFQQKYMSPPSTGNMSPEMESHQKIMKVMMVVMFPVFMYNAPAALSLYFVANSTLGILESKHIRAKFEEQEKLREERERLLPPSAKRRAKAIGDDAPKGFFAKLQDRLAEKMAAVEKMRTDAEKQKRKGK